MNSCGRMSYVLAGVLFASAAGGHPLAAQGWEFLQFTGTESFSYAITHLTRDGEQSGTYSLTMESAGGQMMANVQATLGDASCQATLPMTTPQMVPQMMMTQCMTVAPVLMAMFAPTWMMFTGQVWEVGAKMNLSQGGNQVSFEMTDTCHYAGVDGVRGVLASSDGVRLEACVANDVPLPLAVRMVNEGDGQETEITLTDYNR